MGFGLLERLARGGDDSLGVFDLLWWVRLLALYWRGCDVFDGSVEGVYRGLLISCTVCICGREGVIAAGYSSSFRYVVKMWECLVSDLATQRTGGRSRYSFFYRVNSEASR